MGSLADSTELEGEATELIDLDGRTMVPGLKLADLVVLSDAPTAVDPETIDQIQVLQTIKEGQTVFTLGPDEIRKGAFMWPGDLPFAPLENRMRALYIHRGLDGMPPQYRTADARARLDQSLDDCAAGLVLADIMGINDPGIALAKR